MSFIAENKVAQKGEERLKVELLLSCVIGGI
jgi:hypothetical protein